MIIPVWITFFAFFTLALLTWSRTYALLAAFSLLNAIINPYLNADDTFLLMAYLSIDFMACLYIIFFGDIHRIYQSAILFFMMVNHFYMEIALVNDDILFIESDIYVNTITGLLIAQMIGATYGMDKLFKVVLGFDFYAWTTRLHRIPDSKAHQKGTEGEQ